MINKFASSLLLLITTRLSRFANAATLTIIPLQQSQLEQTESTTTSPRDGGTGGTVFVRRGVLNSSYFWLEEDDDDQDGDDGIQPNRCDFHRGDNTISTYGGEIIISHPSSLHPDDSKYDLANGMLQAAHLIVDKINAWPKCGVQIMDKHYSLALHTFGDSSNKRLTRKIGRGIVPRTHFLTAGYSSSLTRELADTAQSAGRVCITAGSAQTDIYHNRDYMFGLLPPSSTFVEKAFQATKKKGAQTAATITEEGVGTCAGASYWSSQYDMELMAEITLPEGWNNNLPTSTINGTSGDLLEAANYLKSLNPDLVISCIRSSYGDWNHAMRTVNWTPKAMVYTIIFATPEFEQALDATDLSYTMGITAWDPVLPSIPDPITGWTPSDFDIEYTKKVKKRPVYQHVAQASAISILVQSLERIQDLDLLDDDGGSRSSNNLDTSTTNLLSQKVRDIMAKSSFSTVYGNVSFDQNGQSQAPFLLMQYGHKGKELKILLPEETATTDWKMVYPLPTWAKRDCENKDSPCVRDGHQCDDHGYCICNNNENTTTTSTRNDQQQQHQQQRAVGVGASARCIPNENFNYLLPQLKSFAYFLVSLCIGFALFCLAWTYYYQHNLLVKVSQPLCLSIIAVGSIISTFSIIFMGYEAGYRNGDDEEDIRRADFACMAIPWFWGLGFTLTFSSLFSKIWRVKKLFHSATNFQRQKVDRKSIFSIMLGMLGIESAILIAFTVVSPHRWERQALYEIDGHPIESVGRCTSESSSDGDDSAAGGWYFWLALVGFNILCLFYALVLCFQTKNIPSDFAESNHIFLAVMYMFQVLLLAIPVSAMVQNNPDVFYFIRTCSVFLQNFTVLVNIFGPKMWRILYKGEDTTTAVTQSIARGVSKLAASSSVNSTPLPISGLSFDEIPPTATSPPLESGAHLAKEESMGNLSLKGNT